MLGVWVFFVCLDRCGCLACLNGFLGWLVEGGFYFGFWFVFFLGVLGAVVCGCLCLGFFLCVVCFCLWGLWLVLGCFLVCRFLVFFCFGWCFWFVVVEVCVGRFFLVVLGLGVVGWCLCVFFGVVWVGFSVGGGFVSCLGFVL